MYYIYHIPGNRKIGVTIDVPRRLSQQGNPDHEVLEEHTCIYEVSRREIELQKEYGYGQDTPVPYYRTMEMRFKDGGKPKRKVTYEIAKEIRATYKTGQFTQKALAAQYNIPQSNISRIINNKRYVEP